MGEKTTAALFSQQSTSSKWIAKAMRKYFWEVDHLDIRKIEVNLTSKGTEVLYEEKPVKEYDCVYVKGSFRYMDLLRAITQYYNGRCYNPLKPDAYTIGHNKLLTHMMLQPYKIPIPTTYLVPSTDAGKKILEKINYPIVMKLPLGTQGKGVMFADSYASASSLLDTLESLGQPFLIQEYIETSGVDFRLIVVGDKIVASMKRIADMGESRSNIHVGGKGEPCVPDSHTRKLAVETARAVGAEICAVDLLDSPRGPLVVEVNLSPGLQGITACTSIDVVDYVAKHLFKSAQSFREMKSRDSTAKIMKDIDSKAGPTGPYEVITSLDFRGTRVLLPEIVTEITKFSRSEDLVLKLEEGTLTIKRLT